MELIAARVAASAVHLRAASATAAASRVRQYPPRTVPYLADIWTTERNYQPREQLPLPDAPPYTAHLGNLSFDVVSADIEDFFGEASKVTSVRLVEDKIDRKPKGFGYVEFETLDGLKNALNLNGTSFQGRSIKISVADPRMLPVPPDIC